MSIAKRLGSLGLIVGLIGVGTVAIPGKANAWWRGGWCCGVGFGVFLPPVVVAPPVYAPPPVYYAPPPAYYPPPPNYGPPPGRGWVPAHWNGTYWVPGHWS